MRKFILAGALSLAAASVALADTVYVGNLALRDVRVVEIDGEALVFRNAQGRETERPLLDVTRLELDGQRAFNAAEDAFATRSYDRAVEGYLTTVRGGSPDWLKNYAARRLMLAATEAGRADDAASGYAALAVLDPAAALTRKPPVPEKPGQLDAAAGAVESALSRRPGPEARQALLSFLLDLKRAAGQTDAAAEIVRELVDAAEDDSGSRMNARQVADLKLSQAGLALDEGRPGEAVETIDGAADLFLDPRQQAEALYVRARGLDALAGDGDGRADAAIAYLKVVAHFKQSPGRPRVAESMMRAATLLEAIGKPDRAAALYEDVAVDFRGEDVADAAAREAERLRAG